MVTCVTRCKYPPNHSKLKKIYGNTCGNTLKLRQCVPLWPIYVNLGENVR